MEVLVRQQVVSKCCGRGRGREVESSECEEAQQKMTRKEEFMNVDGAWEIEEEQEGEEGLCGRKWIYLHGLQGASAVSGSVEQEDAPEVGRHPLTRGVWMMDGGVVARARVWRPRSTPCGLLNEQHKAACAQREKSVRPGAAPACRCSVLAPEGSPHLDCGGGYLRRCQRCTSRPNAGGPLMLPVERIVQYTAAKGGQQVQRVPGVRG